MIWVIRSTFLSFAAPAPARSLRRWAVFSLSWSNSSYMVRKVSTSFDESKASILMYPFLLKFISLVSMGYIMSSKYLIKKCKSLLSLYYITFLYILLWKREHRKEKYLIFRALG